MPTRCAALLFLLLFVIPAHGLNAQEPLPDEPATTLYRAALELEAEGAYDLADSLMDFILRRYPDSAASAAIRRARSAPDSRRIDSSGRTEFVVWSTMYGMWLGVAVPGTFGAESEEAYGVGLLLGGPTGFFIGRGLTSDAPMGEGDAGAISFGSAWGTWQGFGWAEVLELGADSCGTDPVIPEEGFCEVEAGASSEALFGSMLLGSAIGTATGALLARNHEIDPGDATTASLGSLWGTWYGFGLAVLADVEDDGLLTASLLGGNAGLIAGAAMANRYDITRSQARLASIAGVAGGLAGAGIDLLVQPQSEKVAIAIPLVTSTLGLVLGATWADRGESVQEDPGEGAAPGSGIDWSLGGPVVPTVVEGPRGTRGPGVRMLLLSGRF